MSDELKPCPNCQCPYGYHAHGELYACPECSHEWNPAQAVQDDKPIAQDGLIIKDAHGNVLQDGDNVVIVKDLPVKGASKAIKAGTKVKNIRLTDGDHNIDCKVEGFGPMQLKSEFVKKA